MKHVLPLLLLAATSYAEVSFQREVAPILRANCAGCHKPGKAKGGLDLSTRAAVLKGGKHGDTVVPGKPDASALIESVSGDEPEMPKEGEPLAKAEIELLARWIREGAKDDTAAPPAPPASPVYASLPAVPALAWSPDGKSLAVAAWREVLLHDPAGTAPPVRLAGDASRLESLAFSPDGTRLAVSGGSISEFGEVQIWDVASRALARSIKATRDSLYGVSWSPDATRIAVGSSDRVVRAFSVADGAEAMRCDNHTDWVFGTSWTPDGKRIVSASRDKLLKLIEVASGHLVDDVSRAREPFISLVRHPREPLVVCGSETGAVWLFKMEPRGGRLAEGDDKENSYVRELDRLPGPAQALAWSTDGTVVGAVSAKGEARIYRDADWKKRVQLTTAGGPLFAIALSPDGRQAATAGFDGKVRIHETEKGALVREFDAVPLAPR